MRLLGRVFQVIAVLVLISGVPAAFLARGTGTLIEQNYAFALGAGSVFVALIILAIGSVLLVLDRIDINTERSAEALEALANRRRSS